MKGLFVFDQKEEVVGSFELTRSIERESDGTLSEYDDADVIRRAAHWIVAMDAKEEAERIDWGDDPEVPPSFETPPSAAPEDEV